LREEFVPKIQREVGFFGTESCNEVVLECENGALGSVATMDMGRGANWKSMSEVSRNSCNTPVASLSRRCIRGFKPLDWRRAILRWYAEMMDGTVWSIMGSA
jgi:hypothetical protein